MNKSAALLVLILLAGCKKDPEPVVEPVKTPEPPKAVVKPTPPKPNMAPPLTSVQKDALEKAFKTAREYVKQAREFKAKGDAALKTPGGAAAANDTYVQAKELYQKATAMTEDWVEPDLGKVTEAQVKDYLESYNSERGRWIKEVSDMGKVHKDD